MKFRAAFRAVGDADAATVFFDDFVGDEQPQAAAVADRLGGEEGVEHAREKFGRDAGAAVGQNEVDHRAAGAALTGMGGKAVALADDACARRDDQFAIASHRVVGVDDQVEQHLLQARTVAIRGQLGRNVDAYFDAGRTFCFEEAQGFFHQICQRHRRRFEFAVAGVVQQSTHDATGAQGFRVDVVDELAVKFMCVAFESALSPSPFPACGGGERVFFQDLRGRRDVGQWIVEFMRHAGQQRAQRSQFFRAHQRVLAAFQFIQNVVESLGKRDEFTLRAVQRQTRELAAGDCFHAHFHGLQRAGDLARQ